MDYFRIIFIAFLAILPAILYGPTIRRYFRGKKQHHDEAARLAEQVGGRLQVHPGDTVPWSARFRPAFEPYVTGSLLPRLSSVLTTPKHHHSVDFVRHGRSIRVTEARMLKSKANNFPAPADLWWEYRIDIPAPWSPLLRIIPLLNGAKSFQNPDDPATVQLLPRHAECLEATTTDRRFAELALEEQAVDVLAGAKDELGGFVHLEGGVLYLVGIHEFSAENVLASVDTLVGFLDRIPQHAWPDPVAEQPSDFSSVTTSGTARAHQPGALLFTQVSGVFTVLLIIGICVSTIISMFNL